jgi:hypothetical protein
MHSMIVGRVAIPLGPPIEDTEAPSWCSAGVEIVSDPTASWVQFYSRSRGAGHALRDVFATLVRRGIVLRDERYRSGGELWVTAGVFRPTENRRTPDEPPPTALFC